MTSSSLLTALLTCTTLYAARRVGLPWIQRGIVSLRERRPGMIVSRTTVQKANHLWLSDTVEAALRLGLSGISFLAADLTSEAFNRPLLWPVGRQDSIALSESEVSSLSDEIGRLIVTRREQIHRAILPKVRQSCEKLSAISGRISG